MLARGPPGGAGMKGFRCCKPLRLLWDLPLPFACWRRPLAPVGGSRSRQFARHLAALRWWARGREPRQLLPLVEMYDPQVVMLDAHLCDEPLEQTLLRERARRSSAFVLLDDAVHEQPRASRTASGGGRILDQAGIFPRDCRTNSASGRRRDRVLPAVASRLVGEARWSAIKPAGRVKPISWATAREFELLPHWPGA